MSSLAPSHPSRSAAWSLARWRLRRPRSVAIILLLLVGLAPPAYLAQTGGALTTGYTIQRLQADRNAWKVRNQQLELELAKARSLAWVEAEAINRLGMQKASQQTAVRIDLPPPPIRTESRAPGVERTQPAPPPQPTILSPETSWLQRVGAVLADSIAGR
jgi:hypothetical protein